jgi:hypothetical protein
MPRGYDCIAAMKECDCSVVRKKATADAPHKKAPRRTNCHVIVWIRKSGRAHGETGTFPLGARCYDAVEQTKKALLFIGRASRGKALLNNRCERAVLWQ